VINQVVVFLVFGTRCVIIGIITGSVQALLDQVLFKCFISLGHSRPCTIVNQFCNGHCLVKTGRGRNAVRKSEQCIGNRYASRNRNAVRESVAVFEAVQGFCPLNPHPSLMF
jgi:hypothetical protein